MARLTVYKSDSCGACKKLVPVIKRNAKARGDKVKIVDVDKCSSKECEKIAWTPALYIDSKELSGAELEGYLKK